MADVVEVPEEAQPAQKESPEKKVVDPDTEKSTDDSSEPKENGTTEKNGDIPKDETNGDEEGSKKRKSVGAAGDADAPDGTEGTPEKKQKISNEESEESSSTNGEPEVAEVAA